MSCWSGWGWRASPRARPVELSGGEQQRVAVCAAVAHRPSLLLADEPGGELDASSAHAVYALIAELAREHGTTVVIVSHDPATAAVADRSVQIRDGRLSDETLRHGSAAIVVGRGGWLRVPEQLLRDAGIGGRAEAELGEDGVLLRAIRRPRRVGAGGGRCRAGGARDAPSGSAAELVDVHKTYGDGRRAAHGAGRARPPLRGRAPDGRDRALGIGQEHGASGAGRPRAGRRGPGWWCWARSSAGARGRSWRRSGASTWRWSLRSPT